MTSFLPHILFRNGWLKRTSTPASLIPLVGCPFLLVSQGHGKVHDPRPQMMTADLKQIIVTTSLDWEKRHRTIMWGCLNELLSHRKGHEFILGPMSHKDWACNAGHLPEIVEALGHTQAQSILFRLKPEIAKAASASIDAPSFTPLIETASMCHARLTTRLFIS